jgi:hypothetical protein
MTVYWWPLSAAVMVGAALPLAHDRKPPRATTTIGHTATNPSTGMVAYTKRTGCASKKRTVRRRFGQGKRKGARDSTLASCSLYVLPIMAAANASPRGQRTAILSSPLRELTGFCLAVDCLTAGCRGERIYSITGLHGRLKNDESTAYQSTT